MDFIEQLKTLSTRIENQVDVIQTEEATKTAFVLPFINILGYDVFNPTEVVPEFTADIGTKQGERVDYAIFKEDDVIMLIECKNVGTELSYDHALQLHRYFSAVHARIAVLTNGVHYQFYTDLEDSNKMDTKPFLEFNMLDVQKVWVKELKRFSKETFDLDATLIAASDLKYTKEIKQVMMEQLEDPSEAFVRFFLSNVYSGLKTQTVIVQFTDIVKRALNQFLNELINHRLQSAIAKGEATENTDIEDTTNEIVDDATDTRIITTEEELEGYFTVKSILREVVDVERIAHRDTMSYMGILLDNNRRKTICRLYFNSPTKYLSLVNAERKYEAVKLENIDEIYNYAEELKATVHRYENPEESQIVQNEDEQEYEVNDNQ